MNVPDDGPDRVVCPKCSAKIRVRRSDPRGLADGYIRFSCPCGRRLKVKAEGSPTAGKCPDCGRVVPINSSPSNSALPTLSHPESPTEELSTADIAMLEKWSLGRLNQQARAVGASSSRSKAEAGLRVCPRCGRPVHMGAVACGECGAHVPKR
jgi:DNA-directed RNA polymerase subunit M/transcription elongation factor TFIIS